jgi:proteasome-associated ATPase
VDENRLLAVRLRSGQNKTLYRSDLISGAILASIVQRAKEQAIERSIQKKEDATAAGLTTEDLLTSIDREFREGEMLPPDDAAEEWLKLLDHHPEQVVGVSSYRRGRISEERLVSQII